jgi:hypothetical protein
MHLIFYAQRVTDFPAALKAQGEARRGTLS